MVEEMKEEVRFIKEELDTIKKSDMNHLRTMDARAGNNSSDFTQFN